MVLFNHTGTHGFLLFTVRQTSAFFLPYLFNAVFIKIAVPLFFMASGALLLNKEESYKKVILHRFLRFLIVLIVASFIQYIYKIMTSEDNSFSFTHFLTKIYSDRMITAYWYLYAYLAYLLMLPLLRRLAKGMSNRDYQWMFFLFGLIHFLSILEFLIWKNSTVHNKYFTLFIESNHVFYPLMGYYLDHRLHKECFTRKPAILLSVASIIAILICCLMTKYRCSLLDKWDSITCQHYFTTLIFLPAATVFFLAKMFFNRHIPKEKTCKILSVLSSTTFGIYLIENICRETTQPVFVALMNPLTQLPACWIWILAACLMGAVITFLIKLIPGINKFI